MVDQGQDKADAEHAKIIARAWRDPAFKAKLLADPRATLRDAGLPVPDDVTVEVVENTAKHFHLVLPPAPTTGELSDDDLNGIAGGVIFFCFHVKAGSW